MGRAIKEKTGKKCINKAERAAAPDPKNLIFTVCQLVCGD